MKKILLIIFIFNLTLFSFSESEIDLLMKTDDDIFSDLLIEGKELKSKQNYIESLKGEAYIQKNGNIRWIQIVENDQIEENDTLITMEETELTIKLTGETYVSMDEKSKLYFDTSNGKPQSEKLSEEGFQLAFGKIYSNIRKKLETGGRFTLDSGSVVAGVRGSQLEDFEQEVFFKPNESEEENEENKNRENEGIKFSFETALITADNVYLEKSDTKSDIYSNTKFGLLYSFDLENNIYLDSSFDFENDSYFSETENNENSFDFGIEAGKKFNNWHTSIPLNLTFTNIDEKREAYEVLVGLKLKRELLKSQEVIVGTNLTRISNEISDYKGFEFQVYSEIEARLSGMSLSAGLELESTSYDVDSENYVSLASIIELEKLLRDKYLVSTAYELTHTDNEDDDSELNHLFNLEMKAKLFETNWNYSVFYSLELNKSNNNSAEYTSNEIGVSVSREFIK